MSSSGLGIRQGGGAPPPPALQRGSASSLPPRPGFAPPRPRGSLAPLAPSRSAGRRRPRVHMRGAAALWRHGLLPPRGPGSGAARRAWARVGAQRPAGRTGRAGQQGARAAGKGPRCSWRDPRAGLAGQAEPDGPGALKGGRGDGGRRRWCGGERGRERQPPGQPTSAAGPAFGTGAGSLPHRTSGRPGPARLLQVQAPPPGARHSDAAWRLPGPT